MDSGQYESLKICWKKGYKTEKIMQTVKGFTSEQHMIACFKEMFIKELSTCG